jgi:hypothetical protein
MLNPILRHIDYFYISSNTDNKYLGWIIVNRIKHDNNYLYIHLILIV